MKYEAVASPSQFRHARLRRSLTCWFEQCHSRCSNGTPRMTSTRQKSKRFRCLAGSVLLAMALSGCAGQGPGLPAAITTSSTTRGDQTPKATDYAALNCRRLNGRMQVRILQIRDRLGDQQNPIYAALRSAMNLVQASNAAPTNLDRATARDVQILRAQNQARGEKGCPQFDLKNELRPHPVRHTPMPTIAATSRPNG